jgi:formate hydrogenlyase subunit 3/multisubunit Na+/H+ antiporter MnhD subunit
VTWTTAGLMVTALMAKTALVPLHVWLPPAHAGAPAPVSAILSALVLKASFYLLVRLWFEAFPALGLVEAGRVAGALGAAAIVWGSWLALRQTRLKQVVAYSTVAQVGYLFLLFPLATGAGVSAVPAAVTLHMVSHACAKTAMFMAAGALMGAYGSDDVSRLRGAAVHGSWSALAFALGAMVLIGVPPGGNFLAKWMLIDAAVRTGQWWWVAAIAAGTLMAAAYLFRILKIFMASDGSTAPPTAPGHALGVPALALAGLALALMLAAPAISGLLEHAPPAGLPRAAAALEVRP